MHHNPIKFLRNILYLALAVATIFFTVSIALATNITSTYPYYFGWNDVVGWLDFYQSGNSNVTVASNATTTGYASSSAGDFSLDCATTRGGNVCGTSNYGVYNLGNGNLTGWAWNDTYGWVSFDCHNNGGCDSSAYEVLIDTTSGDFSGATDFAWNDAIGWISFNCNDYGGCPPNFKVNTTWTSTSTSGYLTSTTYDTGVNGGAELNSIVFQSPSSLPNGTNVRFQIATSNSASGPWDSSKFVGYDGTSNTYYTGQGTPNTSIPLNYVLHNNQRYFRYKIILLSDSAQKLTPTINSITVNWSP